MADVFLYNSGSLFQADQPADRSRRPDRPSPGRPTSIDMFKAVVTANGQIYGAPIQAAMGGGMLYNKKVYAELGLSVPKSWAEFMANNEKIKAGRQARRSSRPSRTPGPASSSSSATSSTCRPPCPASRSDYTANKAKFATTPAALKGFQHQATTCSRPATSTRTSAPRPSTTGCAWSPAGEGAHYPMLTFASRRHPARTTPDCRRRCRLLRACPATTPNANGVTAWMPAGHLHLQRAPSISTRPRSSSPSSPAKGAARRRRQGRRRHRPLSRQGLRAAGRRAAGRSPTCWTYFEQGRRRRAGARIPVADEGAVAGADHRRGRLGHPARRRWRRAL